MYYHFELRKYQHNGMIDDSEEKEWDFRSLNKGLKFIKRNFGPEARAWRIEDLTDRVPDIMELEPVLADALMSVHQYLILTFKDDSQLVEKYDQYQFFSVVRDENERPPNFTFSKEEEDSI